MKKAQRKKTQNHDAVELEKRLKIFVKKVHDLDGIKDAEVKSILDPVIVSGGMAYVMQELYEYFGVNTEIIDKINLKSNGVKQ